MRPYPEEVLRPRKLLSVPSVGGHHHFHVHLSGLQVSGVCVTAAVTASAAAACEGGSSSSSGDGCSSCTGGGGMSMNSSGNGSSSSSGGGDDDGGAGGSKAAAHQHQHQHQHQQLVAAAAAAAAPAVAAPAPAPAPAVAAPAPAPAPAHCFQTTGSKRNHGPRNENGWRVHAPHKRRRTHGLTTASNRGSALPVPDAGLSSTSVGRWSNSGSTGEPSASCCGAVTQAQDRQAENLLECQST